VGTSPLLLVDFDGVINFEVSLGTYAKNPDALGYLNRSTLNVGGLEVEVRWSSELVVRLNGIKREFGCEWKWLTTWLDDAVTQIDAVLGTESDGHIPWDPDAGIPLDSSVDEIVATRTTRKCAALVSLVQGNPRPFVWMDDQAISGVLPPDCPGVGEVPHLTVAPDPKYGLLRRDVDRIAEFLSGLDRPA
jgi:hypothetical protein